MLLCPRCGEPKGTLETLCAECAEEDAAGDAGIGQSLASPDGTDVGVPG